MKAPWYWLPLLCGSTAFASDVATGTDAPWSVFWERRFQEAGVEFERAATRAPDDRSLAAGRALALLSAQPLTRENVARADAVLSELERGTDHVALVARYLRARVAEVHLFEPNLALAARRYEALLDLDASHPVAQMAIPKLARLRIYAEGAEPSVGLEVAEALEARLLPGAARRDFHLLMARSYLFFALSPARALEHLQAARAEGLSVPSNDSGVLVSIAELAREQGRTDVARESYQAFLKAFPRDQRVYMIERRLEEVAK